MWEDLVCAGVIWLVAAVALEGPALCLRLFQLDVYTESKVPKLPTNKR